MECFCDGVVKHGEEPCPLAPVTFVPARPNLALIHEQIARGHVHLDIREGATHARIRAGLASPRARTTWVIDFHVQVPGRSAVHMSKRVHQSLLEDEVLELVLDIHRFDPNGRPRTLS